MLVAMILFDLLAAAGAAVGFLLMLALSRRLSSFFAHRAYAFRALLIVALAGAVGGLLGSVAYAQANGGLRLPF